MEKKKRQNNEIRKNLEGKKSGKKTNKNRRTKRN